MDPSVASALADDPRVPALRDLLMQIPRRSRSCSSPPCSRRRSRAASGSGSSCSRSPSRSSCAAWRAGDGWRIPAAARGVRRSP